MPSTADNRSFRNQNEMATHAGITKSPAFTKKNQKIYLNSMSARARSSRYMPMQPLMAPDAPPIGRAERKWSGVIAIKTNSATRPLTR